MKTNATVNQFAIPEQYSSTPSREQEAVFALHTALKACGVPRSGAVAIWIGLKSKPSMIIRAAQNSLADRISHTIARTILDDDDCRLMLLKGHPWWANHGPNQAQLVRMQQRLTSLHLRSFLIRAAQNEEQGLPHFVLLQGIGRAELYTFFVLIPRQLRTLGGVMDLPYDFASDPTPIFENVFLLATLKQHLSIIDGSEILDFCTILSFETSSLSRMRSDELFWGDDLNLQNTLSACREFNPIKARSLFPSDQKHAALAIVGEVLALLDKHGLKPGSGVIKDAYLYLGHSWDTNGVGLFDHHAKTNIHFAGDFWLTQSVIPRIWAKARRQRSLHEPLLNLLTERYSQAEITWRNLLNSANR